MHPKDNADITALAADFAADLPDYWAKHLVLERLPSGEFEYLRPSTDPCEGDDALYTLTDEGRRALAMERCFGPIPNVAEAFGQHAG